MVPTLLVLHKGQVIAPQADAAPADVLRPWVEKTLPGHRPGPPPQRGARTVQTGLHRFVDGTDRVMTAADAGSSAPSQYPGRRHGQTLLNWAFREI